MRLGATTVSLTAFSTATLCITDLNELECAYTNSFMMNVIFTECHINFTIMSVIILSVLFWVRSLSHFADPICCVCIKPIILSVMMLNIFMLNVYIKLVMLSVSINPFMLSVYIKPLMLNVHNKPTIVSLFMLSVFMQSVSIKSTMLWVSIKPYMLSVYIKPTIHGVIMLNDYMRSPLRCVRIKPTILMIMMLSLCDCLYKVQYSESHWVKCFYAECRNSALYTECHSVKCFYAECLHSALYTECHNFIVFMLNVSIKPIMLCVVCRVSQRRVSLGWVSLRRMSWRLRLLIHPVAPKSEGVQRFRSGFGRW